jgi:hypothetical protein
MATSRATPPPAPTDKADHVIWLHKDHLATADAEAKAPLDKMEMKAGETVQFSSKDGDVKIRFTDEWPFEGAKHEIDSSEILTLKKGPGAKFQCQIKPRGEKDFLPAYSGGETQPRK